MVRLVVKGRLPGLNEYTAACRSNRFVGAKMKKDVEAKILAEIDRQLQGVSFASPVTLKFSWYEPNKRRDIDNIAFAKKFVCDALQASGVIGGDGWRDVVGFGDSFFIDKQSPRIEVEIMEVQHE